MADVYKIKATLDTSDVERGAKEIEQRLSAASGSGGGGMGSAKATATLREDTELIERKGVATARLAEHTRRLTTQQRASITLGLGTAAAQLGGATLKAGGQNTAAGALTGAAQGAAQLGTMLAPLGPQAALIGAAAGGITGALTSLVGSMAESRKALEAEAKASRTAAEELRESGKIRMAEQKISAGAFRTLAGSDPDAARAKVEIERQKIADANVHVDQFAKITQDLSAAALYLPNETRKVLERAKQRGTITGEQTDLLKAIHAPTRRDAMKNAYERGDMRAWNQLSQEQDRLYKLHPELMSRKTLDESRLSGVDLTAKSKKASGRTRGGGLGDSSVDAYQSMGMGVYASPMRRSEVLLERIAGRLDDMHRKRPQGALLQ